MNLFVGGVWFWLFALLGLVVLFTGLYLVACFEESKAKGAGGVFLLLLSGFMIYLAIFAGTHFRVKINTRELLVDTINQKVIGVYESGIHKRPLVGSKRYEWPAYSEYYMLVEMAPGVESATTQNGTSVVIGLKMFFDLNNLDIERAYFAVGGGWSTFRGNILEPQIKSVARQVTSGFTTDRLWQDRPNWEKSFGTDLAAWIAQSGYGLRLLEGNTVMSWDFSNKEDATAYDIANRASYLVTQREREKAAMEIESQMAEIRAKIVATTAQGTVESAQRYVDFLQTLSPEMRAMAIEYLRTQVDFEYLRLIEQQKPGIFFPPGGSVGGDSGILLDLQSYMVTPTPQPAP